MGAIVGHWKDLTEAQRLTQSQLVAGVIEEDIKIGNPMDNIPVALAQGKSIKWNVEKTVLDGDVVNADIGQQLTWTSSMEYTPREVTLKRKYIQRLLDNFVVDVYGTVNNYEAQALLEIKKGMMRKLGDSLVYDDVDNDSTDFDGLHGLAYSLNTGTDLDIDEGGPLSLENLRKQIDAMKLGVDAIWMPTCIARRIDAAYYERGMVQTQHTEMRSLISFGFNGVGGRITFFDGIPIVRTDYLMKETDGSVTPRAKNSSGSTYSIFLVKFGDIFAGNPGLCMGFGDPEMTGKLWKTNLFDKLEDYDAAGIRLVTYLAPILGSKLCLGRIYDVTDAVITA